ncbi:branched-chain amino acid transport system II carrier protein [Lactobacillus sp. PV034]|uniref:branched-chain amino acid transport system II carrier protein n=1 Tax=Lactobacillus sp. PV034 TaxID=2594495 RepID=UPI00223F627D|nr:branched-chain amino acid transport system II carrier protein [Lactobacillus sp. PV034]QNQ81092.1 branched-chain amino acid transport system II carrier protein [Lactobacillus sp. PV034]
MKKTSAKKFTWKQYLVMASMIFALFFGAGNLIFPLHLGQLAGNNWPIAAAGFLVTGVLLPLLSLLAVSITHSSGIYGLGKPLGRVCALILMVVVQLTIGPLFATPRTATVPYTIGIAPLLPAKFEQVGLLIFSVVFFLLVFWVSYNQSDILSKLGKVLNPIFLVLLFLIFLVGFLHPMGKAAAMKPTAAYLHGSFINGFLEGYNTLDALAGLVFGIAIVTAIKTMTKNTDQVSAIMTKSGLLAMIGIGVIYCCLIVLGAMSLGKLKVSSDGGVAFTQIVNYYGGIFGQTVLAVLIILTCLTTSVGLVAAFAEDFHNHFPVLSYHGWLTFACLGAAILANLGLEKIISWSLPVLMFLYPLAIVLIILSVCSPLFKNDHIVFKIAMILTLIPAIFDLISNLPEPLANAGFVKEVIKLRLQILPLANIGLAWLIPALIGIGLGIIVHLYRRKKKLI